jgi:hypothetical protein
MSSDESNKGEESDSTPEYNSDEDFTNRQSVIDNYRPHQMFSPLTDITNIVKYNKVEFKRDNCSITAEYVKDDIYIHSFSCDTVGTGFGKNLLHDALIHLKEMYPEFAYITIDPVPQMDPVIWRTLSPADKDVYRQTALLKLAEYYKKLGFTGKINSQDDGYPTQIGDINTILATIETLVSRRGRGTRRRKQRKIVNKRKSNKKGKKGKNKK